METPKEFVVYMCGDKVFGSYNQAFYYYKIIHKPIYYVHTGTWSMFRKVSDLDRHHRRFLQNNYDCDTIDINKKFVTKQLSLLKGVN